MEKLAIPSYDDEMLNNNNNNNINNSNDSESESIPTSSTAIYNSTGIKTPTTPITTPTVTPTTTPTTTPTSTATAATTPNASGDSADCVDAVMTHMPVPLRLRVIDQQFIPIHESETCNSEDSSLSDGDKTLVDTAPDLADISSTNNSPSCSEAHLSDPDISGANFNPIFDNETVPSTILRPYYFKATPYEKAGDDELPTPQRMLKVLVDSDMSLGLLKSALEPHVRVPKEYFKIFRMPSSDGETECTRLTEKVTTFK